MVTHDLREAFELGTRIVAFERPRNRPEEAERYGSRLSADIPQPVDVLSVQRGATVTKDFEIWPKKVAGSGVSMRHGAVLRALTGRDISARDDPRRLLKPGTARTGAAVRLYALLRGRKNMGLVYADTLPGGKHWSLLHRRNRRLRLTDRRRAAPMSECSSTIRSILLERYNAPDTLKCQQRSN